MSDTEKPDLPEDEHAEPQRTGGSKPPPPPPPPVDPEGEG